MKFQVMLTVDVEADSENEARDVAFRLLFGDRGKPEEGVFYWYQVDCESGVGCEL